MKTTNKPSLYALTKKAQEKQQQTKEVTKQYAIDEYGNVFEAQDDDFLYFNVLTEEDMKIIEKMNAHIKNVITKTKAAATTIQEKAKAFVSNKLKELRALKVKQQLKQDYAGLDKVIVSNLHIQKIDLQQLQLHNNVRIYKQDANNPHAVISKATTDNSSFTYSSIKIEDNNIFKSLSLGATITQEGTRDFSHLICFVDREGEANYKPYTIEEFQQHLKNIQGYLAERYGIYASIEEATFKELELNQNIKLNRSFHSYQHVIQYIAQNASKKYSKTAFKSGTGKFTGISLKNKSYELKIYDKKEQLKKKHVNVNDETMRIELSVLNKSKAATKNIKKHIGTDHIASITQQMLNSFFKKMLNSIFLNQLQQAFKKQTRKIKKLAKSFTDAKNLLLYLNSQEVNSKTITLFSIEQLQDTAHFKQAQMLGAECQKTAQSDLLYILQELEMAA